MKKRIEALNKVGRLQARMHDLGRWRLAALEGERNRVGDDLKALFEALEGDSLAYGPQARLIAGRVRSKQTQLERLEGEAEATRRKANAHGLRSRLAGKAADKAASLYRDQKERKELADLVSRAIGRSKASPT